MGVLEGRRGGGLTSSSATDREVLTESIDWDNEVSILSAECFVSVCILYGWGAGHIFHAYRCWLCVWGVCVCVWLARELVINWSDPMARPGTMAAWAQCAGPSSPPHPRPPFRSHSGIYRCNYRALDHL